LKGWPSPAGSASLVPHTIRCAGAARAEAQAGLALDPKFTIARYRAGAKSDNPTYLARLEQIFEGLRKAGLDSDGCRDTRG
jgi:hypothetical protein